MHKRSTDPLVISYLKRVSSMRARDYRQITGDIVFSKTTFPNSNMILGGGLCDITCNYIYTTFLRTHKCFSFF